MGTTAKQGFASRLFESNNNLRGQSKAIVSSKDPVLLRCVKHIDINFHFVQEKIQDRTIELKYCSTHEIVADVLLNDWNVGNKF